MDSTLTQVLLMLVRIILPLGVIVLIMGLGEVLRRSAEKHKKEQEAFYREEIGDSQREFLRKKKKKK